MIYELNGINNNKNEAIIFGFEDYYNGPRKEMIDELDSINEEIIFGFQDPYL